MTKKFAALLLIIMLVLSGCGSNSKRTSSPLTNDVSKEPSSSSTEAPHAEKSGKLIVHFIDVGQGDSELLQLPNGQNMLIDAGTNQTGANVVSYLKNTGIKKVDYLVGTHPHEDHVGGMDNIIQNFAIGSIYMPKVTSNTKTFEDVLRAVQAKSLKITSARAGMTILDQNGLQIRLLAPCGTGYEELNNYSAVIKVQYNDISFLFTGDAEEQSENEMLSSGVNLKADVLKVGHHGSYSATSAAFLKAVAPKYAVISVGDGNDYGHPHQITLDRLAAAGVDVYRTDKNGTIVMTTDGVNINLKAMGNDIKPRAPNAGVNIPAPAPAATADRYIGNMNSKVFHRPDCSSLPADRNRIYFNSRQEAIDAGYSPCKNCNP